MGPLCYKKMHDLKINLSYIEREFLHCTNWPLLSQLSSCRLTLLRRSSDTQVKGIHFIYHYSFITILTRYLCFNESCCHRYLKSPLPARVRWLPVHLSVGRELSELQAQSHILACSFPIASFTPNRGPLLPSDPQSKPKILFKKT